MARVMPTNDSGSSEFGSDQLTAIKEEPQARELLLSHDSRHQVPQSTENSRKDVPPKFFNSWLCWMLCFSGEIAEGFYTSSSYESTTEQRPQVGYPIKPIRNLGNTCYLNAIIQCLNQTTGVHDKIFPTSRMYYLNNEHLSTVEVKCTAYDGSITQVLMDLFNEIKTAQRIVPRSLLNTINQEGMNFMIGDQQDSHEVMRFLLQNLKTEEIQCVKDKVRHQCNSDTKSLSDEEMNAISSSVDKCVTKVEEVFGGVMVSTLICRECLVPIQLDEPFFDIQLSIPLPDQQEARSPSPSVTVSHKNIKPGASNIQKMQHTGSFSDGGDIKQTVSDSELSSTMEQSHFTNASHTSYKDIMSSPTILVASEERVFSPSVNPNNFASLQRYLGNKGMENSPTDLINLSAKDDLEKSLKEFISIDILSKDNKFTCDTCKARAPATYDGSLVNRQVLIKQLPPVLVLHIKRFLIGRNVVYKNTKHLSFPYVLNMAPYCSTNECTLKLKDRNGRIMYDLYGVVVHNGETLKRGHYTAYVKSRPTRQQQTPSAASDWEYDLKSATDENTWYYTSDQSIRRCSRGFGDVCHAKAYLLFYELLPRSQD